MPKRFTIDPDERLDYRFGLDVLLEDGETITSHTIIPSSGITADAGTLVLGDTDVMVWVEGATKGVVRRVTCNAITSEGRTYDRSLVFDVLDR